MKRSRPKLGDQSAVALAKAEAHLGGVQPGNLREELNQQLAA